MAVLSEIEEPPQPPQPPAERPASGDSSSRARESGESGNGTDEFSQRSETEAGKLISSARVQFERERRDREQRREQEKAETERLEKEREKARIETERKEQERRERQEAAGKGKEKEAVGSGEEGKDGASAMEISEGEGKEMEEDGEEPVASGKLSECNSFTRLHPGVADCNSVPSLPLSSAPPLASHPTEPFPGNGADLGRYSFTQTLADLNGDIPSHRLWANSIWRSPCLRGTKARGVTVEIKKTRLVAGLKGQAPVAGVEIKKTRLVAGLKGQDACAAGTGRGIGDQANKDGRWAGLRPLKIHILRSFSPPPFLSQGELMGASEGGRLHLEHWSCVLEFMGVYSTFALSHSPPPLLSEDNPGGGRTLSILLTKVNRME
ncbi:unnamed protein product, partial [Closterium sp. NIES-64]